MQPNTLAAHLQLSPAQQRLELLRPWLLLGAYLLTASLGWWWLAVPLAVAVCLAGFVQTHDAMHQALGESGQ